MNINVQKVTVEAVKTGVSVCAHEMRDSSKELKSHCNTISSSWNDAKGQMLKDIIDECCTSLNSAAESAEFCRQELAGMLEEMSRYDSVTF